MSSRAGRARSVRLTTGPGDTYGNQFTSDGAGFGSTTMTLVDVALDMPLVREIEVPVVHELLLSSPDPGPYWRLAPTLQRRRRYLSPDHVDSPMEPFGLVRVDPSGSRSSPDGSCRSGRTDGGSSAR